VGFKKLIVTVISVALANTAHAQHPMILQKLAEWNAAAPQPAAAIVLSEIKKAVASRPDADPKCVTADVILDKLMPATAERYVFNGIIGRQIRNGWTVLVRQPACSAILARYMIVQDVSGSLRTFRVNRGQSYAHESLIGDTFPIAVISAGIALERAKISCKEREKAKLGVTRIVAEESDLGADVFGVRYVGSWSELWPIEICGQIVEVPVKFEADGDGGAYYNIKDETVKLVLPEKNDRRC
jgi:hypothetical protein